MVAAAPVAGVAPRRISILGATGSIGQSTLSVLREAGPAYEVEAVTANTDVQALARVVRETGARFAAVAAPGAYLELKDTLAGMAVEVAAGTDAIVEAARRPADITVAAIVGAAGLAPTHAALVTGATVALATKECMVSAGDLFRDTAHRAGTRLLPVDSEHNAIFQLLEGHDIGDIERIVLTASGGPFRRHSPAQMADVRPEDALRHPCWSMGAKISIDSATMMNKGLEIIEAFHLFDVGPEQLGAIVHPESIVHGLIELVDGTQLAALGATDMRLPISHCLSWPDRVATPLRRLDLAEIGQLTFEPLDIARFPAFGLATQALDAGGWATNILNAANEMAVAAFLDEGLAFPDIAGVVGDVLDSAESGLRTPTTIGEALDLDRYGRELARRTIEIRTNRQ